MLIISVHSSNAISLIWVTVTPFISDGITMSVSEPLYLVIVPVAESNSKLSADVSALAVIDVGAVPLYGILIPTAVTLNAAARAIIFLIFILCPLLPVYCFTWLSLN